MADEKIFVDGMRFKLPSDKAPEFVKGSISIKVDDFKQFIDLYGNKFDGWLNIDLKVSQGGKPYAELNTWKKDEASKTEITETAKEEQSEEESEEEINIDDIPF